MKKKDKIPFVINFKINGKAPKIIYLEVKNTFSKYKLEQICPNASFYSTVPKINMILKKNLAHVNLDDSDLKNLNFGNISKFIRLRNMNPKSQTFEQRSSWFNLNELLLSKRFIIGSFEEKWKFGIVNGWVKPDTNFLDILNLKCNYSNFLLWPQNLDNMLVPPMLLFDIFQGRLDINEFEEKYLNGNQNSWSLLFSPEMRKYFMRSTLLLRLAYPYFVEDYTITQIIESRNICNNILNTINSGNLTLTQINQNINELSFHLQQIPMETTFAYMDCYALVPLCY